METPNQTPIETSPIETALAEQNVTAQVIAKLKADYFGLTINGIDDKVGFKAVEDARKECKAIRVLASKICVKGREKAVKEQKDWILKEKEVVSAIEEVEDALETESNRIKEEEKRILFEAAQQQKLPIRKEKLLSIGITVKDEELLKLDDSNFLQLFNEFYEKHLEEKAEKLRLEEEARQVEIRKQEAELKAEKLKVHNERKDALKPFWQFIPADQSSVDFSEITPEQFQDILTQAFETKDKFESEQKELEEANKKLTAENEAKEIALKEQKAKAEADLKEQQEIAAIEKALAIAKQNELQKELDDKKAEEEKAIVEANKIKAEEEAKIKAEKEAEKKQAKAPDKEKIAKSINELVFTIPSLTTEEGVEKLKAISDRFAGFKKWALEQVESI